jgi:hypothetical protein
LTAKSILTIFVLMGANGDALEKLIAGGLIGAALGALLSKDKEEGAAVGALLGAAISATREAHKAALQTNEPVLVAIKGKLYKLHPDGRKEFLRDLPQSNKSWPQNLVLK